MVKGRMQQAADFLSAAVQKADELAVIYGFAQLVLWPKFAAQFPVQIKIRGFAERKEEAGITLKLQG